jgi:isopentenyl diphosphate isomerase/L-lactate dehydrogenase-like FMN-dependent dehydrogenase
LPLICESALRSGEDVIQALALGADFVMFGRPILQALAAEGPSGLNALIDAIAGDINIAMAQLGTRNIEQIDEHCLWQGAGVLLGNKEPEPK